jgi:hypothetical protein
MPSSSSSSRAKPAIHLEVTGDLNDEVREVTDEFVFKTPCLITGLGAGVSSAMPWLSFRVRGLLDLAADLGDPEVGESGRFALGQGIFSIGRVVCGRVVFHAAVAAEERRRECRGEWLRHGAGAGVGERGMAGWATELRLVRGLQLHAGWYHRGQCGGK